MSRSVYTQGQFSTVRVLRPFNTFVTSYQGLEAQQNPIAFPGNLDPMAGKPGYDPFLLAGLSVPMGSRVTVWLPRLGPIAYNGVTAPFYNYQFVWRLRSLESSVQDPGRLLSQHFGVDRPGRNQDPGASPSFTGDPGPRVLIPTAFESVQVVDSVLQDPRLVDVSSAVYQVQPPSNYSAPLAPNYPGSLPLALKAGAAGMVGQGFFGNGNGAPLPTNGNAGFSGGPQYQIVDTTAKGDELLILLSRPPAGSPLPNPNWEFNSIDVGLASLLGTESSIGIYVLTGTNA